MINSIRIQNFKSIVDMSFKPGYFNVFIGENGCGKSNILEAIAFAAAAEAKKCEYEFLGNRGIRVSNPSLMLSAFTKSQRDTIQVDLKIDDLVRNFDLFSDPSNNKRWLDKSSEGYNEKYNEINVLVQKSEELIKIEPDDKLIRKEDLIRDIKDVKSKLEKLITGLELLKPKEELSNFMIFAPEHSILRKFEESENIYPLGTKGEGMFQYLRELSNSETDALILDEIRENLNLLDWYDNFNIPDDLATNESVLHIRDRYFNQNINYFDQRSANEGFLFLLFYTLLIVSKDTPQFFAIDNIDSALNPKLCVAMIKNLSALAKKHKKQIIITTHNPAVLDGLNMEDDGQRLFVIRRNDEGHTKIKQILYNAEIEMQMSAVWTRGYIGGLPDNF